MKFNRLTYIISSALLLFSCADNINLSSDGIITEQSFFKSPNDYRLALNGVYAGINCYEDGAAWTELWIEATTDNAINTHSWNPSYQYARGIANTQSPYFSAKWREKYRYIQRCNTIIQNIDVYNWSANGQDKEKEQVLAEARIMRALYYLELGTFYGRPVMITETPNSENVFTTGKQAENPEEVFKFCYTEISQCINSLPERPEIKSYIGEAAGRMLLARTASMLAGYTGEKKYWNDVLEQTERILNMGYSLEPKFDNLFALGNEQSNEVIFVHEYNSENFHRWGDWYPQSLGGNSVTVPTKALVDAFEYIEEPTLNLPYEKKDPRFYSTIIAPGCKIFRTSDEYNNQVYYNTIPGNTIETTITISTGEQVTEWRFAPEGDYKDYQDCPVIKGDVIGEGFGSVWNITPTGFNFRKYMLDQADIWNTYNNYVIVRLAEAYLLRAEALVETGGNIEEVKRLLTEVRERGGNFTPVETALVNFYNGSWLEFVRNERRVELAQEGFRPYDIRRWGIFEEVMSKPVQGVTYRIFRDEEGNMLPIPEEKTVEVVDAKARKVTATYFYWAIPQNEMDIKGVKIEQNPVWK